ncbi:MAG: cytochrome c3 family protein, partial [Chloroflexota bacterium]
LDTYYYALVDTAASGIPRNTSFRARFQVYNDGGSSGLWQPQLEWSTSQTTGYAAVPTASGADPFFVYNTAQFTNGDTINTIDFGLGAGTGTARSGVAHDTQNPAGSSITLEGGYYTEVEFNIQANSNATYSATYYFRLTNGATALTSYEVYGQISMEPAPTIKQAHYRIGYDQALANGNLDSYYYALVDTAASGIPRNTSFRARFQVYNDGGSSGLWQPQLEWSTSETSGYAAVPTASGADPFFVYNTAQFSNGATISTVDFGCGAGTGTARSGVAYDTENPAGSSITLEGGYYTEIEFNIQANSNAAYSATYYFRLANGATVLTSYTVYGQISMEAGPTATQDHYRIGYDQALANGDLDSYYYTAVDTVASGMTRDTSFRVRFQVYNDGSADYTWQPQLEWSTSQTSGYAAVATASGADPFFVYNTAQFSNGATISTVDFGCGTGTGTALSGRAYDTENPAGSSITLNDGYYTEIEFNIQANSNATYGITYYFRLTNNGTALTSYEVYGSITMETGPTVIQAHYRIGYDQPLANGDLETYYYAAVDTKATEVLRNTSFRVRFQLYNNTGSDISWQPQLESSTKVGISYAAVPTTSGVAPFFVTDTTEFTNGDTILTTDFGLGAGTGTARSGTAYDTQNPAGSSITLENGYYTEVEFNIQASNHAVYGKTYYFRLTNNSAMFSSYEVTGAISIETTGLPHNNYTAITDKCASCHRAHTAVGRSLRKAWPEEDLCGTCHNGTGSTVDIMSIFTKTYTHDLAAQAGVHTYGESEGAAFGGSNRHVECEDCHNPHSSSQATADPPNAKGPTSGASGVQVDNGASPGAPTYTFIQPISYEYEHCLKCHSSFTTGYTGTDKGSDFNTNNPSYHPVEGTANNLGVREESFTSGSGWDTHDYDATSPKIYCSDCHGSEIGTDPEGAHGSNIQHILKENYSHTSGTATAVALCYRCHSYAVYYDGASGSRFTGGRRGRATHVYHVRTEGYSCYACHDVHGRTDMDHLMNIAGFNDGSSCNPGGACHGLESYSHAY